jgi:O-6-methylguanine DNA methyltransferase
MPRSQRQSSRIPLTAVPLETPAGVFIAHFSERGLAQLDFPSNAPLRTAPSSDATSPTTEWTNFTREAVLAVLSGAAPVSLPPLDLRAGTPFQQKVWAALCEIASGATKSYSEVAAAIGSPKATRAVGRACGANPIPLLIPCHRVLASGGKLGGFSGGLEWKKRLLKVEQSEPVLRLAACAIGSH